MNIIISIIVAVVLAGGTSMAAHNSLPGDVLYSVKIHVNERVRESIAVGEKAEAEVNARLAEERLREVEALTVHGEFDAEVRARLEQNFQAHADRFSALVDRLSAEDAHAAAEVTSHFEASLEAHQRILAQLESQADQQEKGEIARLQMKLKNQILLTIQERHETEAKVKAESSAEVQAAAEGRIGAAENKIAAAEKFITHGSVEANAEAQARLAEAKKALIEAKEKMALKAYAEAFVLAGEAHRIAQDAHIIANSRMELKAEGRVDSKRPQTSEEKKRDDRNVQPETKEQDDDNRQKESSVEINAEARVESETKLNDTRLDATLEGTTKLELKP